MKEFDAVIIGFGHNGLSNYETPVKNFYLSSALCHPGRGVFGVAGFNTASVILKKQKKKFFGAFR